MTTQMMTEGQLIEELMRRTLDGTITKITIDGRVITELVDRDHIPKHSGPKSGSCKGQRKPNYRHWTPGEDQALLERRQNGMSLMAICRLLNRSEDSVRKRAKLLRDQANPQEDE
jgi:hypothetical protein